MLCFSIQSGIFNEHTIEDNDKKNSSTYRDIYMLRNTHTHAFFDNNNIYKVKPNSFNGISNIEHISLFCFGRSHFKTINHKPIDAFEILKDLWE